MTGELHEFLTDRRCERQHKKLLFESHKANRKGEFMTKPRVVDRGDGPKIAGTRITVYTVLDYLRAGRTRDWIAALLNLSSAQVQAAMDYIRDHDTQVNTEYAAIVARVAKGNPAQVEEQLRANREKVKACLSRQQTTSR
jgi:uncharacterized protein (DUF433 family)